MRYWIRYMDPVSIEPGIHPPVVVLYRGDAAPEDLFLRGKWDGIYGLTGNPGSGSAIMAKATEITEEAAAMILFEMKK